ncbi:MAG TPA: hypothetical protein VFB07_02355 [Vicinamibacterales bacterium]|nr:hypothetical protein [Vicinamibacterales bacterium]
MRLRRLALLSTAIASIAAAAGPAAGLRTPPADSVAPGGAEQRYRILGKLNLALFSVGSNDVGSARISVRSDAHGTTISLLAGSDPDHAPRRLNEWGYVREETRPDGAEIFVLRPADPDDTSPADFVSRSGDSRVAARCASVTATDVRSFATVVAGQPTTSFRTFNRLLQQLVDAPPKWEAQHLVRPSGVQPGFLTALQLVLRSDARAVPYVYNGKVYELSVRKVRPLGRTIVGSRAFDALTRSDLAVVNRQTGDTTKFAVTYVPAASKACLPVQIFYQPSFWVSVELRQDDAADAPEDPAVAGPTVDQIRRICADAAR